MVSRTLAALIVAAYVTSGACPPETNVVIVTPSTAPRR